MKIKSPLFGGVIKLSNLNQRCEQILSILTHERGYVSLRRLSEKTGVSRRSIYYDICKINEWLGSRLSIATDEIFEKRSDQSIYVITKSLVAEFEKRPVLPL